VNGSSDDDEGGVGAVVVGAGTDEVEKVGLDVVEVGWLGMEDTGTVVVVVSCGVVVVVDDGTVEVVVVVVVHSQQIPSALIRDQSRSSCFAERVTRRPSRDRRASSGLSSG
jgi:hypothetical protein